MTIFAKAKLGFVVLLIVFTTSTGFANSADQAKQMLSFFGASCSVYGDWTKGAIAQSSALITTLESLQNDPDCRTVSGALAQLDSVKNITYRLETTPNEKEILMLEQMEEDLLLQLSQTTDPGQRAHLTHLLRDTQIQIAKYTSYESSDKSNMRVLEKQRSLHALVSGTQTLMQQVVANQKCWIKHPSLLNGLGSLAGSVIAASSKASLALPLSGFAQLTGLITEYARQLKITKQMNKVAAGVQATAYHCALESMSQHWCAAQDAVNAIELKARATVSKEPEDLLWDGVKLLDRELPVLLEWLEQIKAGTEPGNLSTAEMQNIVLQKEAHVKSAKTLGIGIVEGKRNLFNKAATAQDKWSVERSVIESLIGTAIYGNLGHSNNPFFEIYDGAYSYYYLMDLSRTQVRDPNGNIYSFSSFDPFSQLPGMTYTPDLDRVKLRLLEWVDRARERVQDEFSTVIQIDPEQTMSDAMVTNLRGDSPYTTLENIKEFLIEQSTQVSKLPASQIAVYQNTIQRLEEIQNEIDLVYDPTNPQSAETALKNIHKVAELDYGFVFLGGRLERSIRLSLNSLVSDGTGIDSEVAALFLAAGNIVSEMNKFSNSKGLDNLRLDALNSLSVTQNNIQSFVDLFGKNIAQTLKSYSVMAKNMGEKANGPNMMAKASLCLKLLASPQWPKSIPFSECDGMFLTSVYPQGPKSTVITKKLAALPMPERICTYRNFLRESKIYGEYYKIKPQ